MCAESSEFEPVFIRFRGRTQGPFGLEQLLALRQRGQFGRAHEISADRLNWTSAATLESVFARTEKVARPRPEPAETELSIDVDAARPSAAPPKPVKPVWHYSVGTESYGPVTLMEMRGLFANGQLHPSDLVWKEGMEEWIPASDQPELQAVIKSSNATRTPTVVTASHFCFACGTPTDARADVCPTCGVRQNRHSAGTKDRVTAAFLALFLGGLGAHHFYLGNVGIGIVYLLFCWTLIPAFVAFIEAISYVCMSDAAFAARYNAGR